MRTLVALGFVFVASAIVLALILNAASRLERLTCEREPRIRCVDRREAWLTTGSDAFEDVVALRKHALRGGWALELVERGGGETIVMDQLDEAEADRAERWMGGRDPQVELVRARWPLGLLLVSLAFVFVLGICGYAMAMQWRERR